MVTVDTKLMTAEELMELPDDGNRYELICGELVQLPMSSMESSSIAAVIIGELIAFVRPQRLGLVMATDGAYILGRDPDTTRVPDASFIRADRVPPPAERRRFANLAPDLAVEVISPSDRASEVTTKVLTYLEKGVRLVWVVDPPTRTVTIYAPDGNARVLHDTDTLDGGDVLPGFSLPVIDIFTFL
jgi:Uma2 family endonuclease